MTPARKKPDEEMRMSGAEFDRIMREALQVRPGDGKKAKKKAKPRQKKKAR